MISSKSEDNGIALLEDSDLNVYSIGVSTAGVAEIRMVENNPKRSVIATSIDKEGLETSRKLIDERGLQSLIELKIEDISKTLPYKDNYFDFVYARLVLHYLDKNQQHQALNEIYRVLKKGSKLFIVVRSDNCSDAINNTNDKDEMTGMTTSPVLSPELRIKEKFRRRYFHSPESLRFFVENSGFNVANCSVYDERLAGDFARKLISREDDELIEMVCVK